MTSDLSACHRLLKPATLVCAGVTLAALSCFTAAAETRPPLRPYTAKYQAALSGVPVNGTAERKLVQKPDGSWELSFSASMLVYSFSEKSRFRFENGKIRPLHYQMRKGAFTSRKKANVDFDWSVMTALSQENEKSWKVSLKTGDLDKISYQQQLQYDIGLYPRLLTYPVIDENQRDTYSFVVEGKEHIQTPSGLIPTTRLKMVRATNKRQTWIWLSNDGSRLLVRLKQTEKGKDYIVTMESATINGKRYKPGTPTSKK